MSETEQAPASGGVDVVGLQALAKAAWRGGWYRGGEHICTQGLAGAGDLIAACSPDAILALCAELTALRARVEEAERLYIEACGERDALAMHGGEDKARLDWLQKQVHDTADGTRYGKEPTVDDPACAGCGDAESDHRNIAPLACKVCACAQYRAALSPSPTPRTEP